MVLFHLLYEETSCWGWRAVMAAVPPDNNARNLEDLSIASDSA